MSRLLGLAACQLEVKAGNIEANLENFRSQVRLITYYSPWVKIIVAPELCFQGIGDFKKTAQPLPGPIIEACCKIAGEFGVYLVPGSIFEKQGERVYNTLPVISDRGELVATYRKMYPWRPFEKVSSGDSTLVFELAGIGKIGVCICYDLWFPELIRDLACKGAEIILVPTCTGTQDRRQEIILSQAAAIQNQCFIVSVNSVGGGKGGSLIVNPEGIITQQAEQKQENLMAMIDLDEVVRSRRYGVAGVSRPLASFFHEKHMFASQADTIEKPAGVENLLSVNG